MDEVLELTAERVVEFEQLMAEFVRGEGNPKKVRMRQIWKLIRVELTGSSRIPKMPRNSEADYQQWLKKWK